jgi:hypothetical protein
VNGWRSELVSLDHLVRDLAAHADKATARSTAKNTEYRSAHLQLIDRQRPWRPTALFAFTLAAAIGAWFAGFLRRDRSGLRDP